MSQNYNVNRGSAWLLSCLLTIGIALSSFAQSTTGSVKGILKTSDGQPAEFVNVGLKGTSKGTTTNSKGEYEINKIEPGTYTLVMSFIGLETKEQEIQIKAGETTYVPDLTLKENAEKLQEVLITSSQRNKFAVKESEYISRMPLKNLENPQVYSVVGKELMKEQVVIERTDIYQNITGAVPNVLAGGSQGMSIRGFATTVGMRNGMVTSAIAPLNPVILERVEVIKGPSGTLFGGNRNVTFGGLYNYVTKKPYENFGGEIGVTAGSFELSRITADINTPINDNKTALFRLNTGWQSEVSFQDQGYAKNYTIAPSFSYQVNERLRLLIDADFTRSSFSTTTFSIGSLSKVTARNFKDLQLDYYRSYINNGVDISNGMNNIQSRIDYKLSSSWVSQTNFLFSEGFYKNFYWTNFSLLTDSTMSRTVRNQEPETFGNIQVQQNFVGDFKIGSLRNRVVIGGDFNNNYNKLYRVTVTYDTININQPIKDINADKINELSYKKGFTGTTTQTYSYGIYVSDVLNITPSLMAMLSLRADMFSTEGTLNISTGKFTGDFEQTSLSPKLGLVYQPLKDRLSVFANYMNGFINLAPLLQPDNTLLVLKPQFGNQWESGLKMDLFKNKLSATISYYDISVSNILRTEVIGGKTFGFQDGSQSSKGVDVEVIASPVQGLNIVAGYAFNENEFTKASPALEGKSLAASPKHIGNIWASYSIIKGKARGLGFGAGGNYVSDSWFESSNTFVLPSYILVNASLFYDQPKYRIALKGNNLLDEQYWNSNGTPQKPMNYLASFSFKF